MAMLVGVLKIMLILTSEMLLCWKWPPRYCNNDHSETSDYKVSTMPAIRL